MIRSFNIPSLATSILLFLFANSAAAQSSIEQGAGNEIEKTEQLGPVTAVLRLSPAEPVIGDILTLDVQVTAESGVEVLMPEFGEALDRFQIIDFVPKQTINDQKQTVATQKYRLQSPLSGKRAIPPILIEFVDRRPGEKEAPDGLDAYELLLPKIEFMVASVVPSSATDELKPPLGKLEAERQTSRIGWMIAVCALAIALAAIPLLVRVYQNKRSIARRKSAYEIARQRLDQLLARPLPQEAEVDAFFVELSSIVRQYLEDRFELRAPELTTEEFLDEVSGSPDLNNDHQLLLREFLKQADLVKFAGIQPDEATIRRSISAAERFIQETRESEPLPSTASSSNSKSGDPENG